MLYKRLGFDSACVAGFPIETTTSTTTANSFELPVLAKCSLSRLGPLRPYVEGGVALRSLEGVKQTSATICSVCTGPAPVTTSDPSELHHRFTGGVTAGTGLEFRHLFAGVFGEIRYTHWTADPFSASNGLLNSVRNRADLPAG